MIVTPPCQTSAGRRITHRHHSVYRQGDTALHLKHAAGTHSPYRNGEFQKVLSHVDDGVSLVRGYGALRHVHETIASHAFYGS